MNWYKTAQLNNEIQAIMDKWKQHGVHLYIYENKDILFLNSIIVPKEKRKQGIGTQIMNELISCADKYGKRVELSVGRKDDHNGTTSRGRLVDFYKRFGFYENKGRRKDYRTMSGMIRKPSGNGEQSPV